MPVSGGAGSAVYVGGGGGAGITSDGASSATYLDADKVHEVQIVGGQLYESTTKNIYQVGTGLPTSGTPTETALVPSPPSSFGPDQFALVDLGGGNSPDTLYVANGSNGSGTSGSGQGTVLKCSLESGVWTATGSVTVPLAAGLVAQVVNGVAYLYVTGATAGNAANNTILYGITDSSGFGGMLSGSPTTLATAPDVPGTTIGTDFKGLAFAPSAAVGPVVPEAPFTVALPAIGAVLLGGFAPLGRRRRAAALAG
jgi:hypothetical protein